MRAQLLASVLLDNSASPLQHALETTELANAPSPLCGLDDSQLELSFICGVEGTDTDKADAVETMILDVLNKVAEDESNTPAQPVATIELQQREIGGTHTPSACN